MFECNKWDYLFDGYLRERELERKVCEECYKRIFNDLGWEK